MPSFFVQMFPSELYKVALEKEFALAYNKLGSVDSWQNLPAFERDWHFNKLVEVRNEEKRQHEEEMANIRAKSNRRR